MRSSFYFLAFVHLFLYVQSTGIKNINATNSSIVLNPIRFMPAPPVSSTDNKNINFSLFSKTNAQKISKAATKKKTLRPTSKPVTPSNSLLIYGDGDPTSGIGAVVKPQVVMVFWGSQWNTLSGDPVGADTILKNFFMNVGGSTWLKTTEQYCTGTISGSSSCSSGSSTYNYLLKEVIFEIFILIIFIVLFL